MLKHNRARGVAVTAGALIAGWMVNCGGEAPPTARGSGSRALHVAPAAKRHHHEDGELAVCPGIGTRHIWFSGNVQIVPGQTWPAWDASQPRWTGLTYTATYLWTDDGTAESVVFYFLPEGDGYGYHALLADTELELASGRLHFDKGTSALESVEETLPLRLWGPHGFEEPIELSFGSPLAEGGTGLDGVTTFDTGTGLWYSGDGREGQLGVACGAATAPPDVSPTPAEAIPDPEPVLCAAHPSTRITVQGNLDPEIPIMEANWDAARPDATSTVYAYLSAIDPHGVPVGVILFLTKRDARRWEYHAMLLGDVIGPELGAGRLVFNTNGTLERMDVWQALRLPLPDGTPGSRLTIDLGRPTSQHGTGADGLTSFPGATLLISSDHDGSAAAISAQCLAQSPVPLQSGEVFWGVGAFLHEFYPACAGSRSTRVVALPVLSRFAPVATTPWDPTAPEGPSDYWTSTLVFDTELQQVPLEIRFRRVAEDSWEAHVLLTERGQLVERATSRLDVDTDGLLAHVQGDRSVFLRLPDGSQGPPVTLDYGLPLDERGFHSRDQLVRYQEATVNIYADGWGPDLCDQP